LSLFLCSTIGRDQNDSLTWNSLTRYHRTHLPASYSPAAVVPLVIAMSGTFGPGPQLKNQPQLSVKSDQEGFIIIYPHGVKNILGIKTWNASGWCGSSVTNNADNVGFIKVLINSIEAQYAKNGDEIHLTGIPNGAYMSYRSACELTEIIIAITPVFVSMHVQDYILIRDAPVIHFHQCRLV
jgi:polyhydroxybutyrate depolymerase